MTPDGAHRPGNWSNDDTIDVRWSGASDLGGSGLAGYAVEWNTTPEALPDPSLFQTGAVTISHSLATNAAWYVHIRPRISPVTGASRPPDQGPFFIDTSPPSVPGLAIEGSAVLSGTWQSRINDPVFRWAPPVDVGSGVVAYDLYWGTDPAGTGTRRVTAPAYDPPTVPGEGAYYLRGRALDYAGNASNWSTLFVFAYDPTPPSPLLPATETRGTPNDTWQKTVKDPAFTWPAATSSGASVAGYEVYWARGPCRPDSSRRLDRQAGFRPGRRSRRWHVLPARSCRGHRRQRQRLDHHLHFPLRRHAARPIRSGQQQPANRRLVGRQYR